MDGCSLLLFGMRRSMACDRERFCIGNCKVEPKYLLLGGVIGAGITWTVIKSMEQLGPAKAALLIVFSQLIIAYLIELFGLFGVEKQRWNGEK